MIQRNRLNFSVNAKLGKLIGRELITNNIIAVFELIKNSYDAFASRVTVEFINFDTTGIDDDLNAKRNRVISSDRSAIIISDNGSGMSFNEIEKNWMEIGTTNKEQVFEISQRKRSGQEIKRTVNGEKGIGRFGADKLGAKLKMISVDKTKAERSTLLINWDLLDDHNKQLQDIDFSCEVETLSPPATQSGVTLRISALRDIWIGRDVINLMKQLKKLVSPFSQEDDEFSIYVKFSENSIKIENDSFEYANAGIDAELTGYGDFRYTIYDNTTRKANELTLTAPSFGPVLVKILYMDAAAKRAFAARNKFSTREYGNIKLFRDNFRILPYGEPENDWLSIDNKHAQAVFRTLGTRDIIGYVQITKKDNPRLKDATNRQGLNEDITEFEEFKDFIWRCLDLLQEYIFNRIKSEAHEAGKIINYTVQDIKTEIDSFRRNIPEIYKDVQLPQAQRELLVERTISAFDNVERGINQVDASNKQLSKRLMVMEKIVGTEDILFDILHAIKNKLATLESMILMIKLHADRVGASFDNEHATTILSDIAKMVHAGLRRTSPARRKIEPVIVSEVIRNFVREMQLVHSDVQFQFVAHSFGRVMCNADDLRNTLDNLMDNAIKATKTKEKKIIRISVKEELQILIVEFEDNGMGIRDEDAPFIFNVSFTRTKGTGIGLATVHHFMEKCNGRISYIKNGSLGGALFELRFPTK